MRLWKENLFLKDNQGIFTDFFQKVTRKRDGDLIQLDVLRNITKSLRMKRCWTYNNIGQVDKFILNQEETYTNLFQIPLLDLTREYYQKESIIKSNNLGISEYMIYVKYL